MNTISILAMALVIYLFGGYVDPPKESRPGTVITVNKPRSIAEWRVSFWFAVVSPLIGILSGLLCLFVFAR